MRLIDADALKELIASNVYPVADAFNSRDYGMFWTGGIEKAINEMPSIDAVKHGRWIKHVLKNSNIPWGYDCSVCDEYFVINEWAVERYKYCPNCGADMRKPKLQYGDEDTLQGGLMSAT